MSLPPVELATGSQICKKKMRHIFLKNQKIINIKFKKTPKWTSGPLNLLLGSPQVQICSVSDFFLPTWADQRGPTCRSGHVMCAWGILGPWIYASCPPTFFPSHFCSSNRLLPFVSELQCWRRCHSCVLHWVAVHHVVHQIWWGFSLILGGFPARCCGYEERI